MPGSHGNQLQGAESSHFNHNCEHEREKMSRKRNKTINTQRSPTAMLPTYSKTVKEQNQLHFVLDPKVAKLPFSRRARFRSRNRNYSLELYQRASAQRQPIRRL